MRHSHNHARLRTNQAVGYSAPHLASKPVLGPGCCTVQAAICSAPRPACGVRPHAQLAALDAMSLQVLWTSPCYSLRAIFPSSTVCSRQSCSHVCQRYATRTARLPQALSHAMTFEIACYQLLAGRLHRVLVIVCQFVACYALCACLCVHVTCCV